jgi:hypothetical protein
MAHKDTRITLKIKPDTAERLKKRMVYGDSFDTGIKHLLDLVDRIEGKISDVTQTTETANIINNVTKMKEQ